MNMDARGKDQNPILPTSVLKIFKENGEILQR